MAKRRFDLRILLDLIRVLATAGLIALVFAVILAIPIYAFIYLHSITEAWRLSNQQFFSEAWASIPLAVKAIGAGLVAIGAAALFQLPSQRCNPGPLEQAAGCKRTGWRFALGWHRVKGDGFLYNTYCPVCWKANERTIRAKQSARAEADRKYWAGLREKALACPRPDERTVQYLRGQLNYLDTNLRGFDLSGVVQALEKHGPHVPDDILQRILSSRTYLGERQDGYYRDDPGVYERVTFTEEARLSASGLQNVARECLTLREALTRSG